MTANLVKNAIIQLLFSRMILKGHVGVRRAPFLFGKLFSYASYQILTYILITVL